MLSAYRVELGTRVLKKKSLLRKARAAKCFCHPLVSSQSAAAMEDRVHVRGRGSCFAPVSAAFWVQGRNKVDHGLEPNPSGWLAGLHQSDNTHFTLGECKIAKYLPGAST